MSKKSPQGNFFGILKQGEERCGFDLRRTVEILNIEERIPKDHLLRKIDGAVRFEHIYDLVSSRYSADKGRRSIDPIVLFKIVLIQHLYGIPSLRQTMREIDMNMAYRWFLGYNFSEDIPHFATVSYAFTKRYDSGIVEEVFRWILYEAEKEGLLEPEVVFVDATHIKANANLQKRCKKAIPQARRSTMSSCARKLMQTGKLTVKSPLTTMTTKIRQPLGK